MLIDATRSSLLIVDVQERLLPVMAAGNSVIERSKILLKAAKALDVPVAVSEQYPKGLGHTVEILNQEIGNAPVFEKLSFSSGVMRACASISPPTMMAAGRR